MRHLVAIVMLVVSVWGTGGLVWWVVLLAFLLALPPRALEESAPRPYTPWEEGSTRVEQLAWIGSALIDLSADVQRALHEEDAPGDRA